MKVHQAIYTLLLIAYFLPCIILDFLLHAEYHLKRTFKELTIRHSYQFLNVPSHEWHSWSVDDGSSILSELVVKLYNRKWLKYCVRILLVGKRRVIMVVTTEADNDRHLI